jgi:hypothetical protein
MKLNYFLPLLLVFGFLGSSAQDFRNFTTEEGLSSNEVYDVFQDKNGTVWFATDRGLCQYNGYEFRKYAPKDGITDITVFDFFPQENGTVWCSTFNRKIFYFQNGSNRFIPFKYNNLIESYLVKYNKASFFVKHLAVDKKGTIYLSNGFNMSLSITANGKLSEYRCPYIKSNGKIIHPIAPLYMHNLKVNLNANGEILYTSEKKSPFRYPQGAGIQRNLMRLKQDNYLVIADSLVQVLNKSGKHLTIPIGNSLPVAGGQYDSGHFWVGYRNKGLKVYDLKGNCTTAYLPHATVSNLMKDCYGGLWVTTTDYGVYYLPQNNVRKYNMENNVIQSLTKDDKNNLFVGTYNGDLYKKSFGKAVSPLRKAILNSPAYVQFFEGRDAVVSCNGSQLFFNDTPNKNGIVQVTKISDDNPQVLSMSQYGSYTIWDGDTKTSGTMDFRIHDISKIGDKIYFGTIGGLKVMHKGKISQMKNPLFKYRIDDLDYSAERGILYAASLGKGVLVYDIAKDKVYSIDKTKGLSDDIVTEIYIENANTIWACTNYGLSRIHFTGTGSYKVDYITTVSGLVSNQVKDMEIIKDSIYIGTFKGLCSISKQQFEQMLSQKHYFLRLKETIVNNKFFALGKERKLDLDYDENQIDFGVEAVSFMGNEKIEYRYKMEGLDKSWKDVRERKLSYAFMPPGDYTLKVRVMDDGRSFSKECITLPIHIDKPFWKTIWFISFVCLLTGAVIYFFFKIRVLSYNEDIVRELLRLLLKRIKTKDNYFSFKESGKDIRIKTSDILFVQSSGNYVDIVTQSKTYTVRGKIGDFVSQVQDPLEFLRIHRSFIIRIDKIEQKSKKAVYILHHEIPVGETYLPELDKILF